MKDLLLQENVTNFANTTNRTINLTGLKPGLKYQLIVKNEGDEWNETITTGQLQLKIVLKQILSYIKFAGACFLPLLRHFSYSLLVICYEYSRARQRCFGLLVLINYIQVLGVLIDLSE